MSRAVSHEVGGDKVDRGGDERGGVGGRLSKERGAGDGDCLRLSFRVILRRTVTRDDVSVGSLNWMGATTG